MEFIVEKIKRETKRGEDRSLKSISICDSGADEDQKVVNEVGGKPKELGAAQKMRELYPNDVVFLPLWRKTKGTWCSTKDEKASSE